MSKKENYMEECRKWFELLDFQPLFYIMDKGLCRIMCVKKEDRYEYYGVFVGKHIMREDGEWPNDVYPANLSKQQLQEYVTNYEFTKSKKEAYDFLESVKDKIPMTTEQMQNLNQDQNFHY